MNCNEFRESIAERLDDELSAQQAQDFDAHEQVCPTCRSALHQWRQLTDLLRAGWPSVDPPAHAFPPPTPVAVGWKQLDVGLAMPAWP